MRKPLVQKDLKVLWRSAATAVLPFLLVVFLSASKSSVETPEPLSALPILEKREKFGLNLNHYLVEEGNVASGRNLSDLLLPLGVSYQDLNSMLSSGRDVFNARSLRAGKRYTVLYGGDISTADYFIYEPNAFEYVLFDLGALDICLMERDLERITRTAHGTITSSLWKTMIDQDLDYELAAKMEDALAWSVSFHHVQPGDRFKAYYEEVYVDGVRVGVGDLYAAYFQSGNKDHYGFKYATPQYDGFYDMEGRPTKKSFLKAPVKYTRISSKYNLQRFHPVLKRVRPHLGTDYAAPPGTPIYAVANGVVTESSFTSGNGNYVKIRHDKVYETQYLHMQGFAKGIKPGVSVKQGDVIGYVGSTGLATGPHVCFRFWQNGKQVNFLAMNFPEPDPMDESQLPAFYERRDLLKAILDGLDTSEVGIDPDQEDDIALSSAG